MSCQKLLQPGVQRVLRVEEFSHNVFPKAKAIQWFKREECVESNELSILVDGDGLRGQKSLRCSREAVECCLAGIHRWVLEVRGVNEILTRNALGT